MTFNPGSPAIIGNEWYPTIGTTNPIAPSQPGLAQGFTSTTAETITAIELAVTSNPSVTQPLYTLWELFPLGGENPGTLLTVEYPPSADETIGSWTDPLGGTANLWAFIDDAVVFPPVGSDYIITIGGGLTAYRASVDSSAFPLTARVSRLSVRAVVGLDPNRTSLIPRTFTLSLFHQPSGVIYQPPGASFTNNGLAPNPLEVSMGEINPVTRLPWTPLDVRDFDAGDWHIRITATGSVACGAIVTAMSLKVSYWAAENREAIGVWERPSGAVAKIISTSALVEPNGAGAWATNWAKPGTGSFKLLPRWGRDTLINGNAVMASDINWLGAYQDLGPGGNPAGISYPSPAGLVSDTNVSVDAHGVPTAPLVGDSRRAGRFILRTSAPGDSVDSQPYTMELSTDHFRVLDSTQSIAQRFVSPATASFRGVRLVVQPPDTADATLTVAVFTTAGAQVGTGTFTITADDVRALPVIPGTSFRYVEGFLSASAALTNATTYDLRLSVSTTTDWLVMTPYCYTGDGGPSFGGTTGHLRVGAAGITDADAMATLLIQPSAPAAFQATRDPEPTGAENCFCRVSKVDQIVLSWTSTALAAAFSRYEIERATDTDSGTPPVYYPVETITVEATHAWTDRTSARGRPVQYRMRVVATTAAFSDWVYTEWTTAEAYGCELIFTSNERPDLQVVYEREPGVTFGFPDHDSDVAIRLQGRPRQVVFISTEDRGVTKRLRVIANFGREPLDQAGRPIGLEAMFEPLRAITRQIGQTIPYVTVLDHVGNVTYAAVTLLGGINEEPAWRYYVDALITPVSDIPAVGTD